MTTKGDPEEDKIAVAELSSVYHGVKQGHSYLSMGWVINLPLPQKCLL